MSIEKKDVKRILKRLKKGRISSCQVGEVIYAKPTKKALYYIFRRGHPVKCCGSLTFFADCKENMLPDLVRWKIAKYFEETRQQHS